MIDRAQLQRWFCDEVLPLEAALTRFLRADRISGNDVVDIRQDVYEEALNRASEGLPQNTAGLIFTIARHKLIDRARRNRVVSFEQVADVEAMGLPADLMATDRQMDARDALRRAAAGMDALPPRCREVVRLRKVEGLSTREAAERMGVGTDTIERQLVLGLRAMADAMLGGSGRIQRSARGRLSRRSSL
ncbi:MAG TPA: RNA polymerase sigma factor [Sphingomonas sp.]|nr:RNA polymerase sigma factor [Sphingomonas sp.]